MENEYTPNEMNEEPSKPVINERRKRKNIRIIEF